MTPKESTRLRELAANYLKNTLSETERAELEAWFSNQPDEPLELPAGFAQSEADLEQRIFQAIQAHTQKRTTPVRTLWPRIAAAASILIALSAGGYFLLHKKQPVQLAQNQTHDVAPGHNQATLTLANGQKIILTKGLKGQLAVQGSTVIQASNNTIAYNASGQIDEITYNTLTTKRGEQSPYPLELADGTKVWLNAASSITFPTAFNGKDREVKVTGEAYFEVAHNAAQPFRVITAGQTIEDIGTAFDINTYDDGSKTTLLQGAVKVSAGSQSILLKPGQEADHLVVKTVIAEDAIDWHEGYFRFNHEPLPSVMQKISRWYDVDIDFADESARKVKIYGSLSRFSNVSKVLELLELTGTVKCRLDGHKIIVTQTTP